ncbi:MAG TPA: hypothetical protein VJ716_00695 [Gaiellaceae bacterium]|nr:hypothetical protein [Gaiellaceae bacterium]
MSQTDGQLREEDRVVACVECGRRSGAGWVGWCAYRVDDPELDEPPALAFYCPECAAAEFRPNG